MEGLGTICVPQKVNRRSARADARNVSNRLRIQNRNHNAEGSLSMDEAAIVSLHQRTYQPAIKNGHPGSIDFAIRVDF